MPNLVPDPGFELESWTLGGNAGNYEFTDSPVYEGSLALHLTHRTFFDGSSSFGNATSASFAVVNPGVPQDFQLAVGIFPQEPNTYFHLLVQHYPSGTGGAAATLVDIESMDLSSGWNIITTSVTANGADDQIYIATQWRKPAMPPYPVDRIDWYVDSLVYGEDAIAIKLAERGVQAVIALLQSELGTELGLIDTDRADGVTMAVPASADYYNHPHQENIRGTANIHVYEGAFDFKERERFSNPASGRAVYELPIQVSIRWRNRDGDSRTTMTTRGQRYAAGVYNALSKNYDLADSEDETSVITVNRVDPAWVSESETEPNTFAGRIDLYCTIECEEIQ